MTATTDNRELRALEKKWRDLKTIYGAAMRQEAE